MKGLAFNWNIFRDLKAVKFRATTLEKMELLRLMVSVHVIL